VAGEHAADPVPDQAVRGADGLARHVLSRLGRELRDARQPYSEVDGERRAADRGEHPCLEFSRRPDHPRTAAAALEVHYVNEAIRLDDPVERAAVLLVTHVRQDGLNRRDDLGHRGCRRSTHVAIIAQCASLISRAKHSADP
jgi:hypothetical protein